MDIFSIIENVTGFKFTDRNLSVLLSDESWSYPVLRIKTEEPKTMLDNLIHELIHINLTQNKANETAGWKQMDEDFKEEVALTRTHIIVHAVHLIIAKTYMPERVDHIIHYSEQLPYIRSWRIISEIGAESIINTYLKQK